jgi:DNA polymerase III epsilon subunit-like protein
MTRREPSRELTLDQSTVSVFPFCDFGIDYVSTATSEDLRERPQFVFAKAVSEIADFVTGRTVVAIKRRRWLFMKAGWDVRFLPLSAVDGARRTGASIIACQDSLFCARRLCAHFWNHRHLPQRFSAHTDTSSAFGTEPNSVDVRCLVDMRRKADVTRDIG